MTSDYTPREGDMVNVLNLRVQVTPQGEPYLSGVGSDTFVRLIAAGQVELVARVEPDWQPGEIGKHIVTGYLYARVTVPKDRPWVQATGDSGDVGTFRHTDELAGKLVRCKVVPEDEAPAGEPVEHLCPVVGGHSWVCGTRWPSCKDPYYLTCPEHRS